MKRSSCPWMTMLFFTFVTHICLCAEDDTVTASSHPERYNFKEGIGREYASDVLLITVKHTSTDKFVGSNLQSNHEVQLVDEHNKDLWVLVPYNVDEKTYTIWRVDLESTWVF